MVRLQPEIHLSNGSKRPASSASLRSNQQDNNPVSNHGGSPRARSQPHGTSSSSNSHHPRPSPIGRHHRTASANTRELLHRVQSHRQQPPNYSQPPRPASSSSLSGIDYVPFGSSSSPPRQAAAPPRPAPGERGGAPGLRPALRKFAARELAVVLLWTLASRAATGRAAGGPFRSVFSAAVPFFLASVHRRTLVLPFWPGRIAEHVMGRLSQEELGAVLVVHLVIFLAVQWVAEGATPTAAFLARLPYPLQDGGAESGKSLSSSLIHFFFHLLPTLALEAVATCVAVVSLLVMPVLLDLNRVPRWGMVALCYPLRGALLVRWWMPPKESGAFPGIAIRWAADALGGLLAGEVMDVYFPDPMREGSAGDAVD